METTGSQRGGEPQRSEPVPWSLETSCSGTTASSLTIGSQSSDYDDDSGSSLNNCTADSIERLGGAEESEISFDADDDFLTARENFQAACVVDDDGCLSPTRRAPHAHASSPLSYPELNRKKHDDVDDRNVASSQLGMKAARSSSGLLSRRVSPRSRRTRHLAASVSSFRNTPPPILFTPRTSSAPSLSYSQHSRSSLSTISTTPSSCHSPLSANPASFHRRYKGSSSKFTSLSGKKQPVSHANRILMWLVVAWTAMLGLGYAHFFLFVYKDHPSQSLSSDPHKVRRQLVQPRLLEAANATDREQPQLLGMNSTAASEESQGLPVDDGLVHIIHTRFMQSQPHLVDLGLARLELMEVFLWASLQQQTTQNFVLVIRTDPDLDDRIRQPLLALLESVPSGDISYILLASNDNPQSQLRHILELNGDGAVWSGNWKRVLSYLQRARASDHLVLESRLDADDALHLEFVEKIQEEARNLLRPMQEKHMNQTIPEGCPDFFHVWCSARHAEWQYQAPWSEKLSLRRDGNSTKTNDDAGSLVSLKFRGCITAGLTVGHVGGFAGSKHLPALKHQHLPGDEVPTCSKKKNHKRKGNCITYLDLLPVALRARTPTSAGMWNVLWKPNDGTSKPIVKDKTYATGARKQMAYQDKLWKLVGARFGLTREMARNARRYLQQHLRAIATDNLRGQCTSGHSCKESSQSLLQAMIADAEEV